MMRSGAIWPERRASPEVCRHDERHPASRQTAQDRGAIDCRRGPGAGRDGGFSRRPQRRLPLVALNVAAAGPPEAQPGISLNAPSATAFVPARISAPRPTAAPITPAMGLPAPGPLRRRGTVIEIILANGRTVKVDGRINTTALGRLVLALGGLHNVAPLVARTTSLRSYG